MEKITHVYKETLQFVEYFHNEYKVDFEALGMSTLNDITIGSLEDCRQFCELVIKLTRYARKKSLLLVFHMGLIYLTPLEIIFLVPAIIYIAWIIRVDLIFKFLF